MAGLMVLERRWARMNLKRTRRRCSLTRAGEVPSEQLYDGWDGQRGKYKHIKSIYTPKVKNV